MKFNFGEVLSRAWQITWKHKVLWIFGLLASCAGGTGNSSSSYQQRGSFSGNSPITPEMERQMTVFFYRIGAWFLDHQWAIYGFIILIGLLIILQLFLATVGQTGLIRGAYHADGELGPLRFGGLWRESLRYFWRVTGLGFLVWAPLFALFFIILVMFILGAEAFSPNLTSIMSNVGTALILFSITLCCCLFPIIIILGFYYRQALLALLVENLGVFDSLARGWNVLVKNFGELFLIGLIMFGIGLAVGIVLAIPVFIVVIPFMTAFMGGGIQSWTPFLIAFLLLLAYFPISWFLNGIYRTFTESVWTLTYMRLTYKPDTSDGLMPEADSPQSFGDSDKTILAVPNA